MFNSVGVSFNKINMPAFTQYQTIPVAHRKAVADSFEYSAAPSVTNIAFTSVDNSVIGQAVRDLGDVPCPYCGIKLINGKEISHLNKNNLSQAGEEVVNLLKPFEDRMHPVEKQVFGIIKDLSKKEPQKNIRELLDTVRPQHLETVKNQEVGILNRLSQYNNKHVKNKDDAKKLNDLVDEANLIIEEQDANYIFRRRRFMEKLDGITSKMQDKNAVAGIKKIAEELPKSQDNVSTFIVKYTQKDPKTKLEKTPYQIGVALLEPSVGSLEHIVPRHPVDREDGGENKYSNYIYASREWNTKRKNLPLDKWVMKNPEIKGHMQNYIDAVIDKINKGQAMKRCRVYPILVAETIEKESKGLIKLDTSKLKLTPAQIKAERARIEKEEQLRQSKKTSKKQTKSIDFVA